VIQLFLTSLALMLVAHALADYPLQGDWLAKAKNRTLAPVPGSVVWPGAMTCHAGIHAFGVFLATGSWVLAVGEFAAHAAIDDAKCRSVIGYNADQALHVGCKVAWALMLVWWSAS
jgi:hypothetical protein